LSGVAALKIILLLLAVTLFAATLFSIALPAEDPG